MTSGTLPDHRLFYLVPVALVAFYICAWLLVKRKAGHKPGHGTIVVRYSPPAGLSPAALRYISIMAVDGRSYAAILAQLAARKLISIMPEKGAFYMTKLATDRKLLHQLSEEERFVFKEVFEWDEPVKLTHLEGRVAEKIEQSLQKQLSAQYFTRNLSWAIAGLVASGAASAWMAFRMGLFGSDRYDALPMVAFTGFTISIFGVWGVHLWSRNLQAFKLAVRGLYRRRSLPLLLAIVFLYPAMWYLLMRTVTPTFGTVTLLVILVNTFAAPFLSTYTSAGRQLMDEIHGFRQFLQRVEQDRLNRLNPTDRTVQADHEYLPYAIALDVREAWGDHLGYKAILETAL